MRRSICLGLSCLVLCAAAAGGENVAVPAGATAILNENTYYRYHFRCKPAVVSVESFKAAGKSETAAKVCPKMGRNRTTPPPPADWYKAEFNDQEWPRTSLSAVNKQASNRANSFRVSTRAKFTVTDPSAAGDLYLSIGYRGGVLVYLNGTEVARKDLPAGELTAESSAALYPDEAYFASAGKTHRDSAQVPQRNRALGPVKLPASALRKGVNVLAIEYWRSDYHPVALGWSDPAAAVCPNWEMWVPVGMLGVKLEATGRGAVPNTGRGKGFQVWAQDRNEHMAEGDYRDANEAAYPVKIVALRNGSYCGQVGVACDAPIRDLKAAISDLKQVGGAGAIPAAQVSFLYGKLNSRRGEKWCDALMDKPPAEVTAAKDKGAILPVVFRVAVPAGAAPGDYRGELSVSAAGQPPAKVPVELYVANWQVPAPRDFRTFMSMYQSPETVAMQYNVEMWSEPHWKLLEKSWELLGRAGNKVAIVHAVEQTQFGNERSTIYWVKKPDGSYDWDFTAFDRYLALATKHCGKLDHVALQTVHVGNHFNSKSGWAVCPNDQVVSVTVKDPATGKLDSLKAPVFVSEEGRKFWKPYFAAVNARLEKLGMKDALCVGIVMDCTATAEMVKVFDDIWPDGSGKSKWHRGCHVATSSTAPYPVTKGANGVVVLHEYCYGGGVKDPKFGEARKYPGAYYFRNSISEDYVPLSEWLAFGDYCMYLGPGGGTSGIGRICLDFWPAMKGQTLINRYPYSDCMQRKPTICRLSWPGPEGALPTARLEALIEGIQDCEAMIFVADAMEKSRVSGALAEKCKRALEDRRVYADFIWTEFENRSHGWPVLHPHHLGWQRIRRQLYDCAAEVAKTTGK